MLSSSSLVMIFKSILEESECQNSTLSGEQLTALRDAIEYFEDATRDDIHQAAPLEDNAQFWRDHCRDLLQHDMMRQSFAARSSCNHLETEKMRQAESVAANTLLPSTVREAASKYLLKIFEAN